jgi:fatty-acyl-CoA synthase
VQAVTSPHVRRKENSLPTDPLKWPLMSWLKGDSQRSAVIRFADDGSSWVSVSYDEIADLAKSVSAQLVAAGVRRNDVVAIVLDSEIAFPAAFFGVLLAGATPCPMVPPRGLPAGTEYCAYLAPLVRSAQPRLVLSRSDYQDLVVEATKMAGVSCPVLNPRLEPAPGIDSFRPLSQVALLQFTSGSSGSPKGVIVTPEQLAANVTSIRQQARLSNDDGIGSWLPLHHDMGLVGLLMLAFLDVRDMWIMRPSQFIRRPIRWLELFGREGVGCTAAPNFGYQYVARRVNSESLEGMDFSKWRTAFIGAEPVRPETLQAFTRLLAPYGFKPSTFRAGYGLAEAILGVTCTPFGAGPSVLKVDWSRTLIGTRVYATEVSLNSDHIPESSTDWVVSSGRSFGGLNVRIIDEQDQNLPEGYLGEIIVVGSSVASGYINADHDSATQIVDGTLRTGDAGFIYHQELYVLGRMGDSLKINGRSVFAEDIENTITPFVQGNGTTRPVVLCGIRVGVPSVIVILEVGMVPTSDPSPRKPTSPYMPMVNVIRSSVGKGPSIQISVVHRHNIQRTSSGKPRRRVMWSSLEEGGLDARTVFENAGIYSGPAPDHSLINKR